MKAKHFVTLFFVVGLVFAITGLVGSAMARDRINNNREANLSQDSEVIQDTFSTDEPAEAGPAAPAPGPGPAPAPGPVEPPGPPAGGTFFNGTCNASIYSIPAAAFSGDGVAEDTYLFWFIGGYVGGTADYGCIKAPAYLPNGATVTSVWATVRDNNVSTNIWEFRLWRVNRLTGIVDIMAELTTSGASTSIQQISDTSVLDAVINNYLYFYYVSLCLDEFQRLWGVRIHTADMTLSP